jgi:hypothetical protein
MEENDEKILVCISIQHLGQASLDDIQAKLVENKIDISKQRIKKYCTQLQKKDILSINYRQEKGENITCYSMKKSLFSRGIPTAHYQDFIKSPEAKELQKVLEEYENIEGVNKGTKPVFCDYYSVDMELEFLDGCLGFMPYDDEEINQFYRDDDKKIILLASHFRAWFRENQRLINQSSLHRYIAFQRGKIILNGEKIKTFVAPILDQRQGRGIKKWELLPKGTKVQTSISVPSKMPPDKLQHFLEQAGLNPLKGLTGRSSMNDFGRFKLTQFKITQQ